jgi:hypothetical protein
VGIGVAHRIWLHYYLLNYISIKENAVVIAMTKEQTFQRNIIGAIPRFSQFTGLSVCTNLGIVLPWFLEVPNGVQGGGKGIIYFTYVVT